MPLMYASEHARNILHFKFKAPYSIPARAQRGVVGRCRKYRLGNQESGEWRAQTLI